MACIFCKSNEDLQTIEHIVPESLGNKHYTLPSGSICKSCNNKFSRYEKEAISSSIIGFEKTRFGIKSKKGKTPSSKVGDIQFDGDENGRKDIITMKGVKNKDIKSFDRKTGILQIVVPGFEKNDVLIGKFLLKLGFEALYKSQKTLFDSIDFSELLGYLNNTTNNDWPFILIKKESNSFKSIPSFLDKYLLTMIHCKLKYLRKEVNTLIFRFEYGGFCANINLLNRQLEWITDYITNEDDKQMIHPEHFKTNFKITMI
jgi:hypothetical protein